MIIDDKARAAFYAEPTDLDFDQVVQWHHRPLGYVIKTPKAFILAREINLNRPSAAIFDDLWLTEPSENLHVTLAVGDLTELATLIPDHIKTISFQKRGYRLHVIPVARLNQNIRSERKQSAASSAHG